MANKDIFEAANEGNIPLLKEILLTKPDLSAFNVYGFTALHCAAMGSNLVEENIILEVLKLLVDAASPLEILSSDGRTPLYLCAEFSSSIKPVQFLIEAGANPDIYVNDHHIVHNAFLPEVKELLAELTGVAVPAEPEPGPQSLKMNAAAWKKAKLALDVVFNELKNTGLIALQDAGATQSDGFEDCAEEFHKHKDQQSIVGFCFYTRQDINRAKRTSELPLAVWGAPEGKAKDTERVAGIVVEAFKKAGVHTGWNGSGSMRPSIYLHSFSE
ncbi:bifunctional non-homologous end joining protein LigD [Pedobacter cryoconitis]|uniref:ankyrin repeat domain-containing protein n=1 Tax=Pedobacter cryoconitis TaxID=188932 RepID=UPI0016103816|nr:ankyrin repeat domain-containing protein [Pedobacter cryoconitis]MBB6273909.1 bifunctional non-homologous end joining protein LigD [Pedobacter cryoconitis]